MTYLHWIAGTILALAWISRIVDAALGMPSVDDVFRPEWNRNPVLPSGNPRVSIIVPARNEEETIEPALNTFLALDYDNYEVIAVNDRSTGRTGEILDRVSQNPRPFDKLRAGSVSAIGAETRTGHPLSVIHHRELPPGWLGKTHPMSPAANQATGEWLLFTDADVLFKPDSLRRAVAYGEAEAADHVVLFPPHDHEAPRRVHDDRVLPDDVHVRASTMESCRSEHRRSYGRRCIQSCSPARIRSGRHIRGSAHGSPRRHEARQSCEEGRLRPAECFWRRFDFYPVGTRRMGVVNNLTKNFFAVLSFQWWRTVFSVIALAFLNFGPFLGVWLAHGWARVPYAAALGAMFLIYLGMSWRSAVPPYYFLLHPVSTAMFIYTLLRSMMLTLWNGGIVWRGTKYPLDELRKGMV